MRLNLLFGNRHALFADTGAFTATLTLVEQFCATNVTGLIQLNRFDVGGEVGEHTLYAYAVRNLTNGEGSRSTLTLLLDHIALERLDTLFGTLDDLVVNGNVVARFESREGLITGQLFVDVLYRVHDFSFLGRAKVRDIAEFQKS